MVLQKEFSESIVRHLAPLTSGILLAVSFLWSGTLWWVALIAFVPLFFFLASVRTTGGACIGAWIAGFLGFGGSFLWYWNTLPLDWLGVPSLEKGILYVGIGWFLTTFVLSFSVGLWGVAARHILRKNRFWWTLLLVPLLWVFFEYGRAWSYSLLTYGVGVAFGPYFTVGFLGYLLAHHPLLLQLASVGSVYLLSVVVVFCNVCCFGIATRSQLSPLRRALLISMLVAAVVGTSFIPVPEKEEKGKPVVVAALHTNFPPSLSVFRSGQEAANKAYRDLAFKAGHAMSAPDIVVFPEDTRFLAGLLEQGKAEAFVADAFGAARPFIIDSGRVVDKENKPRSRLLYYDSATQTLTTRDKVFLAPQGEYVPKLFSFIVGLFGDSTLKLEQSRTYYPGSVETVGRQGDIVAGGLFCSEMFSPRLYGILKDKEANLLVNVTSHAWFHNSRLLYSEFKAAAQVRAVENRLPLVVAANVSPSFAVNSYGRVIGETEWGKPSILTIKLFLNTSN